ncbi:MAG: GyrI-like domain-containing protein [Ferruginibacter sp.]
MNYRKEFVLPVIVMSLFMLSCGTEKEKEKPAKSTVILRKDTITTKNTEKTVQAAPIINIVDTIALRANVIYIKDSAATSFRLSQKLGQIYGTKLQDVIKQNKLKVTGPPIAWYKSQKAPFFFEAGLPIDKKPGKLSKNILFKTIGGDSALVAHFYGPYELTAVAYETMNEWLQDRKKKLRLPAYEIYVSDPIDKEGKPIDPFKMQTDIVFPHN